jgi:outer membrane protein assembly factor BamB
MKTLTSIFVVLLVIASACQNTKKEAAETTEAPAAGPTLTRVWETDTLLTTCESVLFDAARNILYVSNIAGVPDAKDGNGFISKVNLDGGITELNWVTGLDAPKGLGMRDNRLFVTDIDKVVEIDAETGKVVKSYPVSGAQFLNDITVDSEGKVYASESNVGFIAMIADGKVTVWADSLDGPNGVLAEDGHLLMASWNGGSLNSIDAGSGAITTMAQGIEHPDGIEAVGDGSYLVSTWDGMVHLVDVDGNKTLLLDTRESGSNAADIEFIRDKNLLLVPAFSANKVVAYELSR